MEEEEEGAARTRSKAGNPIRQQSCQEIGETKDTGREERAEFKEVPELEPKRV